jgi:excisionase family DNA binding protein
MDQLDNYPTVITVAEAAKVLRIGRNTCYAGVRSGAIPATRIGGRILIARQALVVLLSGGVPQVALGSAL